MVMAGTKKRYSQGARKKRPSRFAYPPKRIFKLPGIDQRNKPLTTRKTAIINIPVRELKNVTNSFFHKATIRQTIYFKSTSPETNSN
jgi:hypothetical protein